MSEAKHTPGPWRFMEDTVFKKKALFEAAPGITIKADSNSEPICRVSGYLMPLEDNARLIAAAPTLLAACERIEKLHGDDCGDHCSNACPYCQVRAAIKAAKWEA